MDNDVTTPQVYRTLVYVIFCCDVSCDSGVLVFKSWLGEQSVKTVKNGSVIDNGELMYMKYAVFTSCNCLRFAACKTARALFIV